MSCPDCKSLDYWKHSDRRECKSCGKYYRLGTDGTVGRPCIGDKPMTNAERQRRRRARLKESK